jgi:hypothetical protein
MIINKIPISDGGSFDTGEPAVCLNNDILTSTDTRIIMLSNSLDMRFI